MSSNPVHNPSVPTPVPYSRSYYEALEPADGGSRRSAEIIVPMVVELLEPRSVVDIGCGVGSWLSVFARAGVDDMLGVDLDDVSRDLLLIAPEHFRPFDLKQPLFLERTFDLALCLEVAGHLQDSEAPVLVDSLVRLAPVVLFSAPVPFQGGPNQFNEQWPGYWVEHFERRGYVVIDPIRRRIWDNPEVKWWFAQNLLLFVRRDVLAERPRLLAEQERTCTGQLALVHPRLLLQREKMESLSLKKAVGVLPGLTVRAIAKRLSRPKQ